MVAREPQATVFTVFLTSSATRFLQRATRFAARARVVTYINILGGTVTVFY